MKLLVVLLTITAFFSLNANADVRIILDRGGDSKSILIDGVITTSDYQSFVEKAAIVEKQDPIGVAVFLNSRGGNLETAMKIGRYIRKSKWYVTAHINEDQICASACVFILASIKDRRVSGKVVIHRPYLDNDNAITRAQQKVNYKKIEKIVKGYFNEMDIPISLYDEMLAISTNSGMVLTPHELSKFNLGYLDIYTEEAANASRAKELNITKTELNARYNRLDASCNSEYYEFKIAINSSNSNSSYAETDDYKDAVAKYESCRNDIMQGVKK